MLLPHRPQRRDGLLCEKCEVKFRREEERWRQLVVACGGDTDSNPPPSPSDLNCDHDDAGEAAAVPMETAEYETTTELAVDNGHHGGIVVLKHVTFDGTGLHNGRQ